MKNPRNIAGPQVRRLRKAAKWSQPVLAARCARWGWVLSRETLAKIETQIRWVSDFELVCLANALGVPPEKLLPQKLTEVLHDCFDRLSKREE
jgi:transcriptional regulator with XRE-family HTH domain